MDKISRQIDKMVIPPEHMARLMELSNDNEVYRATARAFAFGMIVGRRTNEEEWKEVVGYEGRYLVSNLGRVMSLPRQVSNHTGILTTKLKILEQRISDKGYCIVSLSMDSDSKERLVHRLVAQA